jgi:selenocysteine lyase/cysteine desulfurase
MSPPTPEQFRRRFPIFESKAYLASCSQGALAVDVRRAMDEWLRSWDEHGNPWERWTEEVEGLRQDFAELVNARPREVAVTFSASTALNSVLGALRYEGRDTLVVTDLDFPTAGHVALAQRRRGARVRFVGEARGQLAQEELERAVDERTALVMASHVCYRTGARVDPSSVVQVAHRRGALALIDAYQSAGTEPLDVRSLGVDFLVTGALKYLLGPPGVAFLYVREDLIERLQPLDTGWFAQEDPFAFDLHRLEDAHSANRFQSGSPPVPSAYGARAGLRLLAEVGPARVREHVSHLSARLAQAASAEGLEVLSPRRPDHRGPMVVIGCDDPAGAAAELAAQGVLCSPRGRGLRLSLHYYNSVEDVDRALAALPRRVARRGRA